MSNDFEQNLMAGHQAQRTGNYASAVECFCAAFLAIRDRREDPRWPESACLLAEAAYLAHGSSFPQELALNLGWSDLAGLLGDAQWNAGTQSCLRVGRTWARIGALARLQDEKNSIVYQYSLYALENLERGASPEFELVPVLCSAASCRPDPGGADLFRRAEKIVGLPLRSSGRLNPLSRFEQWNSIIQSLVSDPAWSRLAAIDCCLSAALDCISFEDIQTAKLFLLRARELLGNAADLEMLGRYTAFVERQLARLA
jgi:hypothetical protein